MSGGFRFTGLLLMLLCSCAPALPEGPSPPNAPHTTAPETAPAVPLTPAVQSAPSTPEARRLRFETRAEHPAPSALPNVYRKLLKAVGARLSSATVEHQTRWDRSPPFLYVALEFRVFGAKDEVKTRIADALTPLALPGFDRDLPPGPKQVGPWTYSVSLFPLKAPPGEVHETRVELAFTHRIEDADDAPPCKKPNALTPPADFPDALATVLRPGSTRRLVASRSQHSETEHVSTVFILFHNGEAHDDFIKHLVDQESAAGFVRTSGEGTARQQLRDPHGRIMTFGPSSEGLDLGCRLAGPVLRITLQERSHDRAPDKRKED